MFTASGAQRAAASSLDVFMHKHAKTFYFLLLLDGGRFDATKGFGFVSPKDGSEDLFVHQAGPTSLDCVFRLTAKCGRVKLQLQTSGGAHKWVRTCLPAAI